MEPLQDGLPLPDWLQLVELLQQYGLIVWIVAGVLLCWLGGDGSKAMGAGLGMLIGPPVLMVVIAILAGFGLLLGWI
jgi:hypothetical protein